MSRRAGAPRPSRQEDLGLGNALPVGGGEYELGSKLATGGMAELFVARRVGPGAIAQPVVVKRLLPEMQADPNMARSFLWEAWLSARMRHPNVARFQDFVSHEGRYHLVLEYVQGCDLAAVMRRYAAAGRPFPIPEALEVGIGLLRALGHAHDLAAEDGRPLGVVHRDVSPHNVLLSCEGEVKLTDFGVAKPTRLDTAGDPALSFDRQPPVVSAVLPVSTPGEPRPCSSGLVKGTPGYLAPEQVLGQPVDGRTDLFAVGVILFELLTGQRLFHGHDNAALMHAALCVEVPAMAPLRPACPALLEEVVRRALARDPAGRFASAAQMEEALVEVQASLREPFTTRSAGRGIALMVREVLTGRSASGSIPPPSGQSGARVAGREGALLPGLSLPSRASTPPPPDRDQATVRVPRPVHHRSGVVVAPRQRRRWALVVGMALAAAACAAGAGAALRLREAA